ncbi:hypothetical protein EmuJ_000684000 [Echinococcus multilocularis]|uniref:Uncharacterized protein n=1 Tax=Echinococcus multilocularis TaxID=6211 RepID=A0A068Y7W5_ECHMU|nr:hypothetical protein EmuJ_000684000 [Echinococcus multilocularis]
MSHGVEKLRSQVKDDENCIDQKRIKWICLPGPHHPGYFQNSTLSKDAKRIFSNKPGEHWKLHQPDKSPLDPHRLWMDDRRGFRQDSWYNAPNDCVENIKKNFYTPYYRENRHNLIPRSEELTDFWERHPALLLHDYAYRVPDYYLKRREEIKATSTPDCLPPFKPPSTKKVGEGCLMRFQFMANNYRTFDDGYAVDFDH